MYAAVSSLHNSPVYHLYIQAVTELNLKIIMSPLLIDNSIFGYWTLWIVRRKAQTPNTSFHHRTLVMERQSH